MTHQKCRLPIDEPRNKHPLDIGGLENFPAARKQKYWAADSVDSVSMSLKHAFRAITGTWPETKAELVGGFNPFAND